MRASGSICFCRAAIFSYDVSTSRVSVRLCRTFLTEPPHHAHRRLAQRHAGWSRLQTAYLTVGEEEEEEEEEEARQLMQDVPE